MVGLLQAPHGTQLYSRMEKENRLVQEMSGDNADGTTNIIPIMDIETLKQGYKEIISKIYSPRMFYDRVKEFLREYKLIQTPVHIEADEIVALFRSIYYLGIIGPERPYYWRLIFWTLFHDPRKSAPGNHFLDIRLSFPHSQ